MKKLNKLTLATLGAAMLLVARTGMADTIFLHDLTQNTATGVFTYAVSLDADAHVDAGDGFVIYDFPGLLTATLTGGLKTSQFSLVQTLTSNTLAQNTSVDVQAAQGAALNGIPFDSSSIENLSFVYNGPPTPFMGATAAILTLTSSVKGGDTTSMYGSVDHSGSSAQHPFSFADNTITVPLAEVPLPSSWLGGASLFALLGAGRIRKNWKLA